MRLHTAIAALAFIAISSTPLHAQQFFTPGAEVNGQISVQINGTLHDGIGDYAPLVGLALTLYRGATDSLQLRTDEAGTLRFAIAPGTYRVSTPEPVQWHGRSYRWNIPLVVQPRMGIVNLTVANATVSGTVSGIALADPTRNEQRATPTERAALPYAQKEGALGVMFGFLLTGGGQFYAGKNAKGAVLLGLSIAEAVTAVSMIQRCDPYCTDSEITSAQVLLLPAVFNWVYGMATAPGDVRRWNEEHARYATLRPVLERRDGRTGVGLAVGF